MVGGRLCGGVGVVPPFRCGELRNPNRCSELSNENPLGGRGRLGNWPEQRAEAGARPRELDSDDFETSTRRRMARVMRSERSPRYLLSLPEEERQRSLERLGNEARALRAALVYCALRP